LNKGKILRRPGSVHKENVNVVTMRGDKSTRDLPYPKRTGMKDEVSNDMEDEDNHIHDFEEQRERQP
jgi:hypothetical protein